MQAGHEEKRQLLMAALKKLDIDAVVQCEGDTLWVHLKQPSLAQVGMTVEMMTYLFPESSASSYTYEEIGGNLLIISKLKR